MQKNTQAVRRYNREVPRKQGVGILLVSSGMGVLALPMSKVSVEKLGLR